MESKMAHVRISQITNLLQSCIDKKAHLPGKILHAHILRNGFSPDIFVSNKLIEFYAKCGCIERARYVFDQMPARNVYSWNAIVGACSKSGNLNDASELFERMPERSVVSWNTMIGTLARNGYEGKALNLYYMMNREEFKPSHFTFASILSACGSILELEHGRRCHGLSVKVGLDGNMYVENALLGMYAKCGVIRDAIRIFDEMSLPNEVSCTSMMGGLAQTDHVEEALKMFGKMHRNGIPIDSVALSSILGVCARGEDGELGVSNQCFGPWSNTNGQQIHALVIKLGFESDLHVGNSLIDMYAKSGDIDNAEMVFAALPELNVVSWNVLIAGYGQKGHGEKSLELLQRMQLSGFIPDDVTYVSMLSACVKSGDIETAHQMFKKISNPNVSLWNAILSGYCQKGNYKEAIELFQKMQYVNVRPDRTTMALILSSCAGMGLVECGKQVHSVSIRAMLLGDVFVASGLVDMYSKCGNIDSASRVFNRMEERDVVAWNSMIAGFALHSLNKEAFSFFKQMRAEGMCPTQFSYASVVSSCARLSSSSQGRQIHSQITKDGYVNDIFVGSALIDMYAKCGDIEEARWFFDGMPVKNIVSWNEMIHGYAQNGCGDKAVELFEDMLRREEKPDSVTFIAVLTACSHSGLVDAGIKFFDSMEKEHGIKPLVNHYTCIIDSLGRAGRFEEAEVLMDKMPYKDDPIIWEVLLSACRLHANAGLGKWAAEQLFHLDPQNPSPYVLLANIYAALGRWDDASAVRKLMSFRGIVKDPGYSWIEFKNGVQAFMVDDDLRMVDDVVNDRQWPAMGTAQNIARDEICSN
ncbi:pentatricopeptide repeat-containing protein At4g20770 [Magnolia sinica]|uniref:pentatricopeptide repeat-containing protein At4g20770 n=1 Tax=Magnolia sinica TaxID=86752 RepID=UPI002658AC68|nr:pentatricopeptide repeat-containing protein At4g20770 [Magnolia sinica]